MISNNIGSSQISTLLYKQDTCLFKTATPKKINKKPGLVKCCCMCTKEVPACHSFSPPPPCPQSKLGGTTKAQFAGYLENNFRNARKMLEHQEHIGVGELVVENCYFLMIKMKN